MLTHRDNKLAN